MKDEELVEAALTDLLESVSKNAMIPSHLSARKYVQTVLQEHETLIEWWEREWSHRYAVKLSNVTAAAVKEVARKSWKKYNLPETGEYFPAPARWVTPDCTLQDGPAYGDHKIRVVQGCAQGSVQFTCVVGQLKGRAFLDHLRKNKLGSKEIVNVWNHFLSSMGELWNATEKEGQAWFSTEPVAFLRLGHYGEANSCFKTGGASESSRVVLSLCPNSVIVVFHDDEAVLGRCWGFVKPKQYAIFDNFYGVSMRSMAPMLSEIMKQFEIDSTPAMQWVNGSPLDNKLSGVYINHSTLGFGATSDLPKMLNAERLRFTRGYYICMACKENVPVGMDCPCMKDRVIRPRTVV